MTASAGSAPASSQATSKIPGAGFPTTVASTPAAYSSPVTNPPASSAGPSTVGHHRFRCIATSGTPSTSRRNTAFRRGYVQRSSGPPSRSTSA